MDIQKTEEEYPAIIFKNAPVDCKEHDVFDFHFQSKILKSAIDEDSNIIGIIGEYGSGKSSLTEIFRKEFNNDFNKIVTVNLWDSCQIPDEEDVKPFPLLTKSFLYQLAFANNKKNSSFAQYINERFNKNHGKISFSIATKKALWLFALAGLFLVVFFSLQDTEILKLLPKFFKLLTYMFPLIGIFFAYIGLRIASPVFSLWDSQGKIVPDSSDLFDIYKQITNRLLNKKNKTLIFIEDLDRTAEKTLVVSFLKELYRLLNLLPYEQKQKIVFIVSLKAEEQLKNGKEDNPDTQDIYSKIFDYTLHIKSLHYENCTDIVKDLLQKKKVDLSKLLGISEDKVIAECVKELSWILKDENVSIREIKDRLNEIFILYQTLKNRNYVNSSVELKKCTAVVFLKRKYPNEYYEILRNEKKFVELIRNNYRHADNSDFSISINFIGKEEIISEKFLPALTDMLKDKSIDNDFLMYFYNYPTGSYIKTLDEKEVSDWIIHWESYKKNTFQKEAWDDEDLWNKKIERVITDRKGKVIFDALIEREKDGIPECIYKNEKIFVFIINKGFTWQYEIKKEICKKIEGFINISECETDEVEEKITWFTKLYSDLILYEYDIKTKEAFIKETIKTWIELSNNEPHIVKNFRNHFIESMGIFLPYFNPLFTDIKDTFITTKEIEKLQNNGLLLPLLKEFSENKLLQIDSMHIQNFTDEAVITFFEEKKLLRSSLLSRAKTNILVNFDFAQDWVVPELLKHAEEIHTKNPDAFLQIRKTAFAQIGNTSDNFYNLFLLTFPLITEQELILINNQKNFLYSFVDHSQITLENLTLLSNYCNEKQLRGNDLFTFFEALFFDDDEYKISDPLIIKEIISNIDFTTLLFSSMTDDEIDTLMKFLNPIFELTDAVACISFMEMINCLLPSLEKLIGEAIKKDFRIFDNYLVLINTVNNPTETTIEILKDNKITCPLVPSITEKLYEKKYFIRYIIGKTLFDKSIPIDDTIPLDKYYSALISTSECIEYFENSDLLIRFVNEGLIYKDLPESLLPLFYKLRQPIALARYILNTLQGKSDELKKYLYSIEHFDTEKDAYSFIYQIMNKPYVELLHDEVLFYHIWHRMWTLGQKGSLTKNVNKILGTHYSAKEANKA